MFGRGAIEQIQKALAQRKHLDQDAARPGRLDIASTAAIRTFQSDQGLTRTAAPDTKPSDRFDPDVVFRNNPVDTSLNSTD